MFSYASVSPHASLCSSGAVPTRRNRSTFRVECGLGWKPCSGWAPLFPHGKGQFWARSHLGTPDLPAVEIHRRLLDDCRDRLRSAQQNTLVVPRYRLTAYGRRAFSVAGPTAWNSLPVAFRDPTICDACFRRHLKTVLFAQQRRHHSV